jgi:hypothetical protein
MPTKKMTLADLEFQTIRKMLLGLAIMGRPDLTAYRREVMDDGYGPGYWICDIKPEMAGSDRFADIFKSLKLFAAATRAAVYVEIRHHVRDSGTWEIIGPQPPGWTEMQEWLLSIGLTRIAESLAHVLSHRKNGGQFLLNYQMFNTVQGQVHNLKAARSNRGPATRIKPLETLSFQGFYLSN